MAPRQVFCNSHAGSVQPADFVLTTGRALQAGLTASNCRLLSGAVGVPESSLEVRCCLQDLGDFPCFPPAGVCLLLNRGTAAGPQTSSLLGAKPMLQQHQAPSPLQMEVQFDSLTELEAFWSRIPAQVCNLCSSMQTAHRGCCVQALSMPMLISGADM